MISAGSFVEAARNHGFRYYTGVPCSFLTPFINYVINDETLNYVSSANEGDALATAAGAAIGGKASVVLMQNSGLGNAVSPITSLCYIFRIPILIIATHRGAAELTDEPQHELMGKISGDLFDLMQVPWEYFPSEQADIQAALEHATQYMQREQRPYAFIMKKGSVAPHKLARNPISVIDTALVEKKIFDSPNRKYISRHDALKTIIANCQELDTVTIATTGYTGRELFSIADRNNHLYMVGSMGCASSLGLGLSLARPDLTVVVIDGDGAALMRMGNFATIGSYAGNNFIHILLDNEAHDSTGAQSTVTGNVAFADIASACGYSVAYSGADPVMIDKLFEHNAAHGPRFAHLKITAGTIENLARPGISPADVLRRLMQHINSRF
ncbi:MAG: phosphonopyruvate decarboxylase [Proteobacteria bacterium]|nr:phosphonopyruvate decarboxylase [Pseudomonadota bacterium]